MWRVCSHVMCLRALWVSLHTAASHAGLRVIPTAKCCPHLQSSRDMTSGEAQTRPAALAVMLLAGGMGVGTEPKRTDNPMCVVSLAVGPLAPGTT